MKKELQQILDKIGTTPMEEVEIAKKQQQIDDELKEKLKLSQSESQREMFAKEATLDILDAVIKEEQFEELDDKDITIQDYFDLAEEVFRKVFSFTEKDENDEFVYKEPESQKEMKMLSYIKAKNVRKIDVRLNSLMNTTGNIVRRANELNSEDALKHKKEVKKLLKEIKENNKKAEDLQKEKRKMCLEYSGLDCENMIEWEKDMIVSKIVDMANGNYTPRLGKS